jgi:WhiB family redox-sensing transcriptional regulator
VTAAAGQRPHSYPDSSWRAEAACRGVDPTVFFPDDDADAGPAKAVCARCPVRDECFGWAIVTRQKDGVWGGATEHERDRIRRARSRAQAS